MIFESIGGESAFRILKIQSFFIHWNNLTYILIKVVLIIYYDLSIYIEKNIKIWSWISMSEWINDFVVSLSIENI